MIRKQLPVWALALICLATLCGATWLMMGGHAYAQPAQPDTSSAAPSDTTSAPAQITLFAPLTSSQYAFYEKFLLCMNVVVALAGLGYAWMLVGQVKNADQG